MKSWTSIEYVGHLKGAMLLFVYESKLTCLDFGDLTDSLKRAKDLRVFN